jgi:uncharacterized protein YdaU (DUF1376 family)
MKLDILPLSTSAYIADTQHLTTAHHGAYFLILMAMWRAGGWLNDDERLLANITKTTIDKWRKLSIIIRPLLVAQDGKLTQKRLYAEAMKQLRKIEKARECGSRGGKAKALKLQESPLANATFSLGDSLGENATRASTTKTLSKDSDSQEEDSYLTESHSAGGGPPSRWHRQRRAMIPENWVPSERGVLYAKAKKCFTDIEISQMGLACCRYYRTHGHKLVDLEANWEGWVDREIVFRLKRQERQNGQRSYENRQTRGDVILSAMGEYAAEMARHGRE